IQLAQISLVRRVDRIEPIHELTRDLLAERVIKPLRQPSRHRHAPSRQCTVPQLPVASGSASAKGCGRAPVRREHAVRPAAEPTAYPPPAPPHRAGIMEPGAG